MLHLLAIAREAEVDLQIDDFQNSQRTDAGACGFEAFGSFCSRGHASRGRDRIAGAEAVARETASRKAKTVTGASIGAEAAKAKETPGQEVIARLDKPLKKTGGLVILKGNIAPEGCVAKISGHERLEQRGPARVFESEEEAMEAVTGKKIQAGDVVVIRNEGPKGGPGMREMLSVTGAIVGEGLGSSVALLTDGTVQRRYAWFDGWARIPGSGAGRADCGGAGRRYDSLRRDEKAD